MRVRPTTALPILCLAASLAPSSPTLAQESAPSSVGAAIGSLFEGANLRSAPPKPADFIVQSRPASLDYVPLAPAGAREKSNKKSPNELHNLENEFGAAAAANRARAARVKVPDAQAAPKRSASARARGGAARETP